MEETIDTLGPFSLEPPYDYLGRLLISDQELNLELLASSIKIVDNKIRVPLRFGSGFRELVDSFIVSNSFKFEFTFVNFHRDLMILKSTSLFVGVELESYGVGTLVFEMLGFPSIEFSSDREPLVYLS